MKLLSFGEILWDVYPDKKCIGGAPFNFAAHAKRAGADAYLLTAVGNDTLGSEAISYINHYGVNSEFVHTDTNLPTGQCLVTLDVRGIPRYNLIAPTAYDAIPVPSADLSTFDVLAFGTLALRDEYNRKTILQLIRNGKFTQIFVDINIRPPFDSGESIEFSLTHATILKISDEEFPTVMARIGESYTDIESGVSVLQNRYPNIRMFLITCGTNPTHLFDAVNGISYCCNTVKAEVVSTVGAGDSYGATFLTKYMAGHPIVECMKAAAAVSAFVVSHEGAIPEQED